MTLQPIPYEFPYMYMSKENFICAQTVAFLACLLVTLTLRSKLIRRNSHPPTPADPTIPAPNLP
jgi:hypothetical protein